MPRHRGTIVHIGLQFQLTGDCQKCRRKYFGIFAMGFGDPNAICRAARRGTGIAKGTVDYETLIANDLNFRRYDVIGPAASRVCGASEKHDAAAIKATVTAILFNGLSSLFMTPRIIDSTSHIPAMAYWNKSVTLHNHRD